MKLRSIETKTPSSHHQRKPAISSSATNNKRPSLQQMSSSSSSMLSMIPSTSKNPPISSISAYGTRRSSTASGGGDFSPDSPGIGRIAKSNARLLNGLDLTSSGKGGGRYLDTTIALPELKTFDTNEKCPEIAKIVRSGDKAAIISMDQLKTVQLELEELISLNVDQQKTIHGEITYLTTGEYPTEDLRNRPKPRYEQLAREDFKKLLDRTLSREAEAIPNISLADFGLLSSPEDEETPHILDVPQRFWNWAREYLRHISVDYVKEFKQTLVDKFSEEQIIGKYCCQEDVKFEPKLSPKSSHKLVAAKGNDTPFKQAKRKLFQLELGGGSPAKRGKVAQQHNRAQIVSKLSPESPKSKRSPKGVPNSVEPKGTSVHINAPNGKITGKSSAVSPHPPHQLNGLHPRLSNGVHKGATTSTKKVVAAAINGRGSGMKRPMMESKSSAKIVGGETPKLVFMRKEELEEQSSEDEEEDDDEEGEKMEEDDEEEMEQKPGTSQKHVHGDDWDEVTAELRKKQAQLRELFAKTRPTIEQLYMRVLKEYAINEVFRRMDEADNKLFKVGTKFERIFHAFNKDQRQEAKAAVEAHHQFYAKFHGGRGGVGRRANKRMEDGK